MFPTRSWDRLSPSGLTSSTFRRTPISKRPGTSPPSSASAPTRTPRRRWRAEFFTTEDTEDTEENGCFEGVSCGSFWLPILLRCASLPRRPEHLGEDGELTISHHRGHRGKRMF